MRAEDYYDYMVSVQTGRAKLPTFPPPFNEAQIVVQSIDAGGGILDFNVTDPGYGYYYQPAAVITGGGGYGATAEVTMGNRFLFSGRRNGCDWFYRRRLQSFAIRQENASLGSGFSLDATHHGSHKTSLTGLKPSRV